MVKSVQQAQSGEGRIRTSGRKISIKLYRVIFGLSVALFFFTSVPDVIYGREPAKQKHVDTTFSNGLTVLALEDRSDPLISLWITYRAGITDEPEGKSGIMKVAEEIMKSGSRGYRRGEYSRVIHSGGGTFGSFSIMDLTCYISRFPKNLLRDILLMEADRMEGPLISRERIVDAQVAVRLDRQRYLKNNPYGIVVEALFANLYRVHPYGRSRFGDPQELSSLSVADMKSWMRIWYQPSNAIISIVGDFKTKDILEELAEIFADIPSSERPVRNVPQEAPQESESRTTLPSSTTIPIFITGYHIPEAVHDDFVPLRILANILIGEKSSRVYRKLVVESGKSYFVQGDALGLRDPGMIFFYAFMNKGESMADGEAMLYDELETVKAGDISERELIIAKNRLEAEILFTGTSADDKAREMTLSSILDGDSYRWLTLLDRVQSVTLDDITRVARTYLKETNRTVVLLGPEQASDSEEARK